MPTLHTIKRKIRTLQAACAMTALLLAASTSWGQNWGLGVAYEASAKELTEAGDEAFRAGLYKSACEYYREALATGKDNLTLRWRLAESARLANLYREAADNYMKVSLSAQAYRWPECDYRLGQVLKSCNAPDSAMMFFGRYAKSGTNKELVADAEREITVCQWIIKNNNSPAADKAPFADKPGTSSVNKEHMAINSRTQTAPCIVGDSILMFSSFLEIASESDRSPVSGDYVLQMVYTAGIEEEDDRADFYWNSKLRVEPWQFNGKKHHTCNTAYDPRNNNIYFNYCSPDNFSDIPCEIYVTHYDGSRWQKPKKLGGGVNRGGSTSTQPAVGYLDDGRTILFFVSNREGGFGGLDLWYSIIEENGECSQPVNLGSPINTPGNEITPFYDQRRRTLFFSSDHHYCYGGYDIFMSRGTRDAWTEPVNIGKPFNSPANDMAFVMALGGDWGFMASNRNHVSIDTGTASSSTCCNDIYRWQTKTKEKETIADTGRPNKPDTVIKNRNILPPDVLPITLYFDNDQPDPRSDATSTDKTYYETFNHYMFRRGEYKTHIKSASAIDSFFNGEVAEGRLRLDKLMQRLEQDLQRGTRISITVESYASRLHSQAYNLNLSKRRISSLINQLLQYNGGTLARYLSPDSAGGSLQIVERPYGSSRAADPTGDPVYGLEAARQRFIRIVDYRYIDDDSTSALQIPAGTLTAAAVKAGTSSDIEIHLPHRAKKATTLSHISIGRAVAQDLQSSPKVIVNGYSPLLPEEELVIYLRIDATKTKPQPQVLLPLTLQVQGEQSTHTLFLQLNISQ